MIAEYLRLNLPLTDKEFDAVFPTSIRQKSERHFTPIDVAIKASEFLVNKTKQKILDIGSGTGKFCFIGGAYNDASFIGIDYRKNFIRLSQQLTKKYNFKNVSFIHSDIAEIDFKDYNSFYFFNSFQEHIDKTAVIDTTVETSLEKFKTYSEYVKSQLEKMPEGTRLVTYYAKAAQIPNSYVLVKVYFDGLLRCWEKTDNNIAELLE